MFFPFRCSARASKRARTVFFSLVFSVSGSLLAGVPPSSLKDSWDYYQTQLERGASADQLEQTLDRILSNPDFAKFDLSAVQKEFQRIRTEVAFKESIDYYNRRVESGINRDEQIGLLDRIIAKYDARGMDMTELKARLAQLIPPPPAPEKPAPPPPPPPAPPPPPKPERAYEWNVAFLGGMHWYPSSSFFINDEMVNAKEFSGLSGMVDIRQRWDAISWGLETGGYGRTVFSHDLTPPALVRETHLQTTVIRLSPLVHVGSRENLFDLALGVGGGAYMWRKEDKYRLATTPETVGAFTTAGTVWAGHGTVRFLIQFSESNAFILDYSYALAKEDDTKKINDDGDMINFGGHMANAGIALRF